MEIKDFGIRFNADTRDMDNSDIYYKKLDLMSDALVWLKIFLDSHPDTTVSDIMEKIVHEDVFKNLDHESLGILLQGVDEHFKTKTQINARIESFLDNPEGLFEDVFGIKPHGRVEIVRKYGYLGFVLDYEDFENIINLDSISSFVPSAAKIDGVYFSKGYNSGIVGNVYDGRVFAIARNIDVSSSSQRKVYVVKTGDQLKDAASHEASHAFWIDLVKPLKEGQIQEKRARFDDIDPFVKTQLEYVLSNYFVGDNHQSKFVSESGPLRFGSILKNRIIDQSVLLESGDYIRKMVIDYRKLFFIIFDVLNEVKGKMDPKKFEALAMLLPVDRIERILHFVGIDPAVWRKEWEEKNNDESMRQREEDLVIKLGK